MILFGLVVVCVAKPQIPGGFNPTSVDDPKVKEMALFATTMLNSQTNSAPSTLLRVIQVRTQVVAGRNYLMKIELQGVDGSKICDVKVFDPLVPRIPDPQAPTRKLLQSACVPSAQSGAPANVQLKV